MTTSAVRATSLSNHVSSASIVNETLLLEKLATIFPKDQIQQKVKSLNVQSSKGKQLEFDFWIPKYQVCFEFQDAYHYINVWYSHKTREFVHYKDDFKKQLASTKGMHLIEIPCWWRGDEEELISTIVFQRPDLSHLFSSTHPIPLNPPPEFFTLQVVPDVGELMFASFLPHSLSTACNNTKWWAGEKYDGIRFCWHESHKVLYSRYGTSLPIEFSFLQNLPAIYLDGEVWFGRGQFTNVYDLLHGFCYWPFLRLISFDVPYFHTEQATYEERYKYMARYCHPDHPFNIIAGRMLANENTLHWFLQYIIDGGGEGVIMQKYGSYYERGRSHSLYKLKVALGDQEGIVVNLSSSHHVSLKLPNNARLTVPTSHVLIPTPQVGDIVSFYFEPEDPSPKIYRIRTDVNWSEVVYNFYSESQHRKVVIMRGVKEYGKDWTQASLQKFLENFVKSKSLDPKQAKTWYTAYRLLMDSRSGRKVLDKIKRTYFETIEEFFGVQFDAKAVVQFHHWNKLENRRTFFEDYAAKHAFDALVPFNWYNESKNRILETKGAKRVVAYHQHSIVQALLDLFPNIGLQRSKFSASQNKWNSDVKRKNYFLEYANTNSFDPLVPENWYSHPVTFDRSGAQMLLFYYGNSLSKALLDLFPNIGLHRSKFSPQMAEYNTEAHRAFFETYAKERGFDPLVPENWYLQPRESIASAQGAQRILNFYCHSVPAALAKVFHDIGLEKSKFQRGTWEKTTQKREFFENYAAAKAFDPLVAENWYSQPNHSIRSFPGAHNALFRYNYSISKALGDAFPDIGVDSARFRPRRSFWNVRENRRSFFVDYAKCNGFDPQDPENWYLQSAKQIFTHKNASNVLAYYNKNVALALLELFPNIGLEENRFQVGLIADGLENTLKRQVTKDGALNKGRSLALLYISLTSGVI